MTDRKLTMEEARLIAILLAEELDHREARTRWEVQAAHQSPGEGWEPFGHSGGAVYWRRRWRE
jgi:hypothetical protein